MKEITIRQFLILKTLKEKGSSISGDRLCKLLSISPRTLRYEIKGINDAAKRTVVASDKNGYRVVQNKTTEQLLASLTVNSYLDTTKAVTLALLTNPESSVYDIADSCFISESTVFNIVRHLAPKFSAAGLKLTKKGELIYVTGDEAAHRKMLSHFFFSEADSLASQFKGFCEYFSAFQLIDINNLVNESLLEMNINIDTIYFKNIVISLIVALQRIADGQTVAAPEQPAVFDQSSCEYIFLQKFLEKVYSRFGLTVGSGDFQSMLSFIAGSFRNNNKNVPVTVVSEPHFKETIHAILDDTLSHYNIQVSYENLFDSFVLHIHYLLLRSQNDSFFKNDRSLSLKYSHPYIYDVAVYLVCLIEKEFHVAIHPDEIDLIAIYLGTIIRNSLYGKSRVICVCPKYNSIRQLFISQIEEKFGSQIHILDIVESQSEIHETDSWDFLITVVKNEYNLSNAICVSPLLTPRDIRRIENKLVESVNRKKDTAVKERLMKYFDPQLFFHQDHPHDGRAILELLNARMKELNYVPEEFLDSVYKREAMASSAFFNRFSIPHALNCKGKRTKIAYYYSERGIDWFGEKINLVLLLSVEEYDEDFTALYNMLFDILLDNDMYQRLVSCRSYEELLDYVSANF